MTEKQRRYIERMNATAGWSRIGRKGGINNARKAGSEEMSRRGFRGAVKLIESRGGYEAAKQYFSEIGSMPKRKVGDADGEA